MIAGGLAQLCLFDFTGPAGPAAALQYVTGGCARFCVCERTETLRAFACLHEEQTDPVNAIILFVLYPYMHTEP